MKSAHKQAFWILFRLVTALVLVISAFSACGLQLWFPNAFPTYKDTVLASNPLIYYRFNESSGTVAVDSSGNHLDASYVNTTLGGSNIVNHNTDGGSISEANSADYVALAGATLPTDKKVSVECWIKPSAADLANKPNITGFINNGNQAFLLTISANQSASFEVCGIYLTSPNGSIVADKTYQFVGTYDTSTTNIVFYINGVQAATGNVGTWCNPWTGNGSTTLYVGGIPGGLGSVGGNLSECSYYDGVLDASTIAQHYDVGS